LTLNQQKHRLLIFSRSITHAIRESSITLDIISTHQRQNSPTIHTHQAWKNRQARIQWRRHAIGLLTTKPVQGLSDQQTKRPTPTGTVPVGSRSFAREETGETAASKQGKTSARTPQPAPAFGRAFFSQKGKRQFQSGTH